jgi:hypothetical protein
VIDGQGGFASEALDAQTFPLEICDITSIAVLGVHGFNMPSLLSINAHAPYLHRSQVQTLEEVISLHLLPALVDVLDPGLSVLDSVALLVFLKSIDGTTAHFRSGGMTLGSLCHLPPQP